MATQEQIEGLPAGAVVTPIQGAPDTVHLGSSSGVEGLPPGAVVTPIQGVSTPPDNGNVSNVNNPPSEAHDSRQSIETPEARTFGNYAREAVGGVASGLGNLVSGAYQAVRHPINTAVGMEQQMERAGQAAQQEFRDTEGADLPSRIISAGLSGAEQLPIVGPAVTKASGPGGIASPESLGAGSQLATELVGGPEAASRAFGAISRFRASRTPVPTENFTPRQASSHAAVIAEGTPAGDTGYIPRDIAQATSSRLRSTAAKMPQAVRAIQKGSPEDAYAAHQAILDQAKRDIDIAHEQVLKPVENTPVDTTAIQRSITPNRYQAAGMDPSDIRAIDELRQRAANVKDLRSLNEFRKTLNTEDMTLRNSMAPGKSALYPQTVHDLANAARDAYYDALEKATGQSFRAEKQLEGNIIQEQRGALGSGARLSVGETKANAPSSIGQTAADVIDTGGKIPVAGYVASRLRGTKLGQIQQHLQRFYSNLPEPPQPVAPTPPPPRNMPLLEGATIENAPGVGPEDIAPTPKAAPPAPATITPTPDAVPQLPAHAGPEGSVVAQGPQTLEAPVNVLPPSGVVQPLTPRAGLPQLPPPSGAPDFATQPASPPPPVAPEFARERVTTPAPPNPQPTPPGRTTVTPEGVAIPERKALPAPIKAPKSGKSVRIGDTVSVNGRTGKVTGVNAKTGRIMVDWE